MELLFIWINKSKNKFIKEEGFNFSPKHKFICQVNCNNIELQYYEMNAINKEFLYGSNISNITAIVGQNGTGKTTLLQQIYNSNCTPKTINKNEVYRKLQEERYENNKTILVYKINHNIVIYHNIEENIFKNTTKFEERCISHNNTKKNEYMNELHSFTVIYLTNSLYTAGSDGYSTYGKLNEINLTPNSLRVLSNKFYERKVKYPDSGMIKQTRYNMLQKIIIKNKKETDFQQICDIIYFHYLISKGLSDSYISKMNNEIEVNTSTVISAIEKEYPEITEDNIKEDDINIKELRRVIKKFEMWLNNIDKELLSDVCGKLYLSLIFEIMYCLNIDLEEIKISELEEFLPVIDNILNEYNAIEDEDKQAIEYYKDALLEVISVSSILIECKQVESNVPPNDLAYKKSKLLSFKEDRKRYIEFCKIIDSMAKAKQSFVIKYINISNLYMSSGERAFQNIFSWLNLLPFFDQIIERENVCIQKSILILIDEVDLYAHPEWQRKYISVLIDEVSKQFKEKEVQIIFTTHSPIVLSDVLRESTIYLSKPEDKCIVDDSKRHKQTFGSNIHTLLNDAFYMKSTIGEFSKNKIEQVYAELSKYLKNNLKGKLKAKSEDYKLFIDSIGEPLIKNKLSELYNKCFNVDKDAVIISYQSKIETLKKQLSDSSEIDKDKVEEAKNKLSEALEIIKSMEGAINYDKN